jgi:peptidoglycan-associated lipoprotein
MRKAHWLVVGVVASAAILSACSSTPKGKGGQNIPEQRFSDEAGRTSGLSGDSAIEIGSPEWEKLGRFAAKNKCEMIQAVGGVEQHIFFEFDQSNLPSDATDNINAQAKYLLDHSNVRVRIEGNADDRGSREYNVALGMRRATNVVGILKEAGVPARQIDVVSYGAEKPMAFGEKEESYRCNRRVDIVYIK